MKENKEIYFSDISGKYYPFKFYFLHDEFPDTEGIYIFTRSENGNNEMLYIGETETLKDTIRNHEKWVCVSRRFVNALCVHFEKDATVREQIVSDLIEEQRPPCND